MQNEQQINFVKGIEEGSKPISCQACLEWLPSLVHTERLLQLQYSEYFVTQTVDMENKHKQRRSCIPANLKHSVLDFPSTRATAKAAVKVSPAPVVSRTLGADILGCFIGSSPSMNRAEPLAPSFTRTLLTP